MTEEQILKIAGPMLHKHYWPMDMCISFAKAIEAAHLEELANVEMPEPVMYGTAWGDVVTLDQCREAVAAAVARQAALVAHAVNVNTALLEKNETLTAERDDLLLQLDKEGIKEMRDEIVFLKTERDGLKLVNTTAEIKDGLLISKLTAERDALQKAAARYQALRNSGYLPPEQFDEQVDVTMAARAALEQKAT